MSVLINENRSTQFSMIGAIIHECSYPPVSQQEELNVFLLSELVENVEGFRGGRKEQGR